MPSVGIVPRSGGCIGKRVIPTQDAAPVRASFRWMAACITGDWASGNSAFTIFRGSRSTSHPYAWARPLLSWHALVPFTFRIQVSHRTQEPPSEFFPAAPGIQQGASWRTGFAAERARRSGRSGQVPVVGEQVPAGGCGLGARRLVKGTMPVRVGALTA